MRLRIAILVVTAVPALAWEGPPPPELEGALRTGVYEISNLLVRNAPATKQNGSAWDPFGGAADIQLEIYTDDGSGLVLAATTPHKENSGTSAVWSGTFIVSICGPEDFSGPETQSLFFKVWDSDTASPDFMDSGLISTEEICTVGTKTVNCNYGTTITFDIEWVGMQ